jgi:hypothetical protein
MKDTIKETNGCLNIRPVEAIGTSISPPVTTKNIVDKLKCLESDIYPVLPKPVIVVDKGLLTTTVEPIGTSVFPPVTTKNIVNKLKFLESDISPVLSKPVTVVDKGLPTASENIIPSHLPWMIGGAVVTTIIVAYISNIFQQKRFTFQLKADYRRHLQISSNETKQLKYQLDHNSKILNKNNNNELLRQKSLFEHERSQEELRVIREKKELLIRTFNDWEFGRRAVVLNFLSELKSVEAIKTIAPNLESEVNNINTIKMLLDLYFFDNKSRFQELESFYIKAHLEVVPIGGFNRHSIIALIEAYIGSIDGAKKRFVDEIIDN